MQPPSSRNAPCPCGSGKRYKECHGAIAPERVAAATPDPRLMAALAAQNAGKLSRAAELYAEVARDTPQSFDAVHMLGVVHYQQGDFDSALELIDRALALQPGNSAALLNRRLIVSGIERRPIAAEIVRESLRARRRGTPPSSSASAAPVRVIAFYLPQYHRIPENDAWWGEGFTEWTNVRRGRPMFPGHWQPHEPGELGYYELTEPSVRERQADLARAYGVDAFCYYHYWFGGKRLLEQPLDAVLASGKPDFPFCICWANENWTRRWDGLDQEILMAQRYSAEDSVAFITSLLPFFRDRRYVRVNGRPLLLVYKTADIPDLHRAVETWRDVARREGIGELYLASVQRHALDDASPAGFDGAVEFPPIGNAAENVTPKVAGLSSEFRGAVFEYSNLAAHYLALPRPAFNQFRGVTPMWDNTARRDAAGMIVAGSTPELFRVWLEYTLRQTRLRHGGDDRLLFVNAWNEWAEGNHLEPDSTHGRGYLEALRDAREVEHELRPTRPAMREVDDQVARLSRSGAMSVDRYTPATQRARTSDVSIVMPVYNHARFLARTLDSIARQTLLPAELIAVDDGSTDASVDLIERFARSAPFVVTVVRQANAGAHAALNRGLALARQATVALINSDDMYAPQRLERLVACLTDTTELAFSGTEFVDDNDAAASGAYAQQLRERIASAPRFPNLLYTLVVENIAISTGNLVFRRSLLERTGAFASLSICLDWDFLLGATYATDVAFVPDPLYRYRLHDTNAFSALRLAGRWEGELALDGFFRNVRHHPWLTDDTRAAFFAHARAVGLGGYLSDS